MKSPLFIKAGSQIDLYHWSGVAFCLGNWVRIHGVDVVSSEVHNDHLGISGLSSRSYISPDILRGNLSIFRNKMILKAWLIINVSFPDHSWHSWMILVLMPSLIIINSEFSFRIFDESIGVVDT